MRCLGFCLEGISFDRRCSGLLKQAMGFAAAQSEGLKLIAQKFVEGSQEQTEKCMACLALDCMLLIRVAAG